MSLVWYSEKGIEVKEGTLVELYKTYQTNAQMNLELHYKYRYYYGVLFSALVSVFVAGVLQFYKELFSIVLTPIPILIFYLSISGKKTVDRYYRRFLENIVMFSKIENMLGVDSVVKVRNRKLGKIVWPDDKQFIVARYYRARFGTEEELGARTSEEFVEERMKKGDNITAHRMFTVFQIIGIVLILLLVLPLIGLL